MMLFMIKKALSGIGIKTGSTQLESITLIMDALMFKSNSTIQL